MQIGTHKAPAPMEPPSTTPSSVGERLKSWRRSRHETQDSLAKILEVDVGVLRKYENGVNAPGSQFLGRACAQGLNINWLLSGYGPMLKPDVLNSMAPEVGAKILGLGEVLAKLERIDSEKFDILLRGFTLRTVEAQRTAELEQESKVKEEVAVRNTAPTPDQIDISAGASAAPDAQADASSTLSESELSDIIVPGALRQLDKK